MASTLVLNMHEFGGVHPYPESPEIFDVLYNVHPNTFDDFGIKTINVRLFKGPAGAETEVDLSPFGENERFVEGLSNISLFGYPRPNRSDIPPDRYRVVFEHYSGYLVTPEDFVSQRTAVFEFEPSSSDVWEPVLFSEGFRKYLHLQITGSSENWLISDISTFIPPSGFEYYYYVGGNKIRSSTKLTNYPWQTNDPVEVHLCFIKPSIPDINYWLFPKMFGPGWGDPDGGLTLDKADIGAYESYIFKRVV